MSQNGYKPNPGMSISEGNRNVKELPMVGPKGLREWSYGLFGCFEEPKTCFMAWCFPCVTYAKIKHRYEHLEKEKRPDPDHGGGCCSTDCMLHGCLLYFGCAWALQMGLRGDIRKRYFIQGGGCSDCCTACWCSPCELTQEARELALEEGTYSRILEIQKPE